MSVLQFAYFRERTVSRIAGLSIIFAALTAPLQVFAQAQYPNRAISMIIPAPPGGPTDAGARILARSLADLLGQPVVADNRPGAATMLGTAIVAKAAPDGYTIGALVNAGLTSVAGVAATFVHFRSVK